MLTRGPLLLLPLLAIFGMSDIILEIDAEPKVQAQREDIRAFYARLVLTIATTAVGSYLSLHQLAKSFSMYQKRRNEQSSEEHTNLIDYLMNSPIAVAELGVLAMIGIDYVNGDGKLFGSYMLSLCVAVFGSIPISSLILFSMPVAKKLREIRITSLAWTGHNRDLTALDCLSFCVAATLCFSKFFRMINADGALLTITMLQKFPITNLTEGCMVLGMNYVLHLSLVCSTGEFLNMGYEDIDGSIRLIGKYWGNRNQQFYVFNVIVPGLTQALLFRYDVMRHL